MLKRLLCCLLCFCMLFSLVSCGNIFDFNGEESTTEEYVTTKKPHKYDDEDEEEDEDYEDEDDEEISE